VLCCLASLIGCLGYAATNHVGQGGRRDGTVRESGEPSRTAARAAKTDPAVLSLRPAVSAVTWGFFIYLFLISGTLLAVESPFANTTPDQYLRLAGTASLLAFVVGWQPEVLMRLVSQVGASRMGARDGEPSK
jgi:hypothetical protein